MDHGEFRDPALVPVYDVLCPWSRDDDFFLGVVDETPAVRVLDLGCGTGRLTLALAAAGHTVTGVDPAPASLAAARAKPGAGRVTWIDGTSAVLPAGAYDVALMTSHVAQFLVEDHEWAGTLTDLHRALVPGGRLVFDSRDPRACGWERWNPVESREEVTLPDGTPVVCWTDTTAVDGGRVSFTQLYGFPDGIRRATATMRFRTESEIRSSMQVAGFAVEHIYGGWNREPVGAPDGELLVLARA